MSAPKLGFEMRKIRLSLAVILPVRQVKDAQKKVTRYRTILSSVKEVGLVEPLVVYPQKGAAGKYLLLDGHVRYFVLKDLGETEADCIIASDDECYTYNARVNRLNPNLTCARGYIKKLLDNAKVVRFLNTNHRDILAEFESLAAAETV